MFILIQIFLIFVEENISNCEIILRAAEFFIYTSYLFSHF
jgi:hypothetical protein